MPTSHKNGALDEPETVHFRARAEVTDSTLEIVVEVENRSDVPIVVRLIPTNGRFDPIPGWAYVSFREEDDSVHLLSGQPPTPDWMDVYAPVISLSRRVAPDETIEHRYAMPLPLEEWNPNCDRPENIEDSEDRSVLVRRVHCSTEWLFESDVVSSQRRDSYPPGFDRVVGSPIHVARLLLETVREIPVHVKTWGFMRF